MKRLAALFLLALAALPAYGADYLQAVEFPYYLYPRTLWERELVWLKNIGVQTVEFSIPANYHQLQPGEFDLTGRTSPRRDLIGFVRLLRKLGLRAWVRPLPPVPGLVNARLDAAQQRAWLKQLEQVLATQTASHGGPDRLRGRPRPGHRCRRASRAGHHHLRQRGRAPSRAAARPSSTARGALLWTDVEDAIYPAGWAANPSTLLRKGAVGLSGDEHPATGALRRDAALLRGWARLFADLRHVTMPEARRRQTAGRRQRRRVGVALRQRGQHHQYLAEAIPRRPARGRTAQQKDAADSRRERGRRDNPCGFR